MVYGKGIAFTAGNCALLKLREHGVSSIAGGAEKLNKLAHEILARIQELKSVIKERIGKPTEL